MAYAKTTARTANVTTVQAAFHNSIMAELKAATEGIPTHDVDIALAYTGGSTGNMLSTVTITDNSPSGDAGYDITLVGTLAYNSDDTINTVTWVFNAGEMNITMTETFSYTGANITGIGRTLS